MSVCWRKSLYFQCIKSVEGEVWINMNLSVSGQNMRSPLLPETSAETFISDIRQSKDNQEQFNFDCTYWSDTGCEKITVENYLVFHINSSAFAVAVQLKSS